MEEKAPLKNNLTYEQLVETLECVGDGIISTDLDARILYMNSSAEELTGYKLSEARGLKFHEVMNILNGEKNESFESPIKTALIMGQAIGLMKNSNFISRDGKRRYISASCSPIRNSHGRITGVVVTFRDISRLIKVEKELIDERNNFKEIFESSPIGSAIVDSGILIKQVNPSFLRIFQKELSEVLNEPLGKILYCLNSKTRESGCGYSRSCKSCKLRYTVNSVIDTGIRYDELEMEYVVSDNAEACNKWLRISFVPVNTPYGRCVMLVIDDITDRKNSAENLKKAKEDAEAANRAKSRFLANMSHEIRTPLNGMVGMIDLTLRSGLNSEQKENLNIARSCASSLLKVINDILDFSKMEAGKLMMEEIVFDIKELVEDVIKVHAIRAEEKSLEIFYQFSSGLPQYIIGDPGRIKQILNNLIGNAVKFTEKGNVAVSVKKYLREGNRIELLFSVADTGIGIGAHEVEMLFKSFTQVDSSYTRKFGGTGLGLVISKQLIEMMEGRIWVVSELNRGSTFNFTVKLNIGEKNETDNKKDAAAKEPADGYRILFVEDDKVNQIVVNGFLKDKGNILTFANNGKEALDILEQNEFDIILMDINLPKMDGIEATNIIRMKEKVTGKHVPIIAVTAYALKGDREKFLSMGMDGYVSKPIDCGQLIAEIKGLIKPAADSSQEILDLLTGQRAEAIDKNLLNTDNISSTINDISKLLILLKADISGRNMAAIEITAHSIKNLFSRLDAIQLKNQAFRIELAVRRGSINEVKDILVELIVEFEKYKKAETWKE